MNILKKALKLITGSGSDGTRPLKTLTERELIELESEIGREIFGDVPTGHRREFFCLDDHTWVWHEEWIDENKKKAQRTTRYEVHESSILKVRDGGHYEYLKGEELNNFGMAVKLYYEQVTRKIYKRDPYTGKALTELPSVPPATIVG